MKLFGCNIFLLFLQRNITAMAQYVRIGILYQTHIHSGPEVSREHLEEKYPPQIFDYKHYDEESCRCLRSKITGKELEELRTSVLDFCGVHGENDRNHPNHDIETEIRDRLSKMTLDEAEHMAMQEHIYSFTHIEKEVVRICLDNTSFRAREDYFIIHSFGKFYHEGKSYICEATSLLDRLIQGHLASDKYGQLVMVFLL